MALLACDLGGTSIKLGIVREGEVVARASLPSGAGAGLGARLPAIADRWRSMTAGESLEGISVAFPSIVDPSGRITSDIGKYPDAMGLDLKEWARAEFGLPLAIDNDARMAAIGEWRYGAGKGYDDLVMVTLGTGIGTSVIIEGKVLRGRHGQAGCLGGHLVLRYDGHPCSCGSIGCAEAEASTSVLHRMARDEADCGGSTLVPPLDYEKVFHEAAQGDPCAASLRDRSIRAWSALAVSLIHAYDPEVIVVGGGVANAGDWLLRSIQEYTDRHAWTPWGKVRVLRSRLGDDAALVAGEWLFQERQG
ncbi:MAG TPA: ROK family protein [Fimbriimonas sp.]